jgi:hypothetical protein
MAGAHATALVALVWSACPQLRGKVAETTQLIQDTATPLSGQTGANCGGDYTSGPNNDWGFGTIDALVAVQAALALCGENGYLNGRVTQHDTQAPIEDAAVMAVRSGGGHWQDSTDETGAYSLTLVAGTYTVTVSAFGYAPEAASAVIVQTATVTTRDFSLTQSPNYVVSGTVREAGTGAPLAALVEVPDTPLASASTDPDSGFYSMTLPAGDYDLRATAFGYRAGLQHLVVDRDLSLDFTLVPLPCILLVDDDDNTPDVRGYYTSALETLGYDFDLFEVGAGGAGPALSDIEGYSVVIWFSGDKYQTGGGAGPNAADEVALSAYLDGGGRFFLSSQDYLYDMGRTGFGRDYLGIGQYVDDTGDATTKHGVPGDPVGAGLGPYPLSYPPGMLEFGDSVTPTVAGSVAFRSRETGGSNLDLSMLGEDWRTVFFATSWVAIAHHEHANGAEVLQRVLDWFGACGECVPVSNVDFAWDPPAPGPGEPVAFTGAALGTPPIDYSWSLGDGITAAGKIITHTYQQSGHYTVVMTATNCASSSLAATNTLTVEEPIRYFIHFPLFWHFSTGCFPERPPPTLPASPGMLQLPTCGPPAP